MKKYKEVKVVAKNAPKGSYAAGCPAVSRHHCNSCDFLSWEGGGIPSSL